MIFLEIRNRRLNPASPPLGIKDHAIIGDLHTVALVDLHATIDFLCLPRLDSPTVFARLLDPRAGYCSIELEKADRTYRQIYVPDTNVLVTRIASEREIIEITDFMVVGQDAGEPILVRRLEVLRGRPTMVFRCVPAFGYASLDHRIVGEGDRVSFIASGDAPKLHLIGESELSISDNAIADHFSMERGTTRSFVFGVECENFPKRFAEVEAFVTLHLRITTAFWQSWAQRSTYKGRHREAVMRSALMLKLMVSSDHGSIAAAATFGLPEVLGGARNWDYRYSWVRDASFAVYAFIRLGYVDEAVAYMKWLSKRLDEPAPMGPLQPVYCMDGSRQMPERELGHLQGFARSQPVTVGNGARRQLQLDIYGAFMDALYLTSKYSGTVPIDDWAKVVAIVDWVCENWQTPDEGIWEVQTERKEFLHSRVMCWVAIDRAIRLAGKRSLPAPLVSWVEARATVFHSIRLDFWDEDLKSLVRSKGSKEVDASTLMLPLVRFLGAHDPRWESTQLLIEETLAEDDLVFRYRPRRELDGLDGVEGAFTTCSFWLIECFVRQGHIERAGLAFAKMMDCANHVGLFSEEIGTRGEFLGNFPQALTHLAMISAACALDKAMSGQPAAPWS